MADYILKNIDKDTWRRFKTACAFYDINIRTELIRHIRNIISDYNKQQRDQVKAAQILKHGRKKP